MRMPEDKCRRGCPTYFTDPKGIHQDYCGTHRTILKDEKDRVEYSKICGF